MSVAGAIRTIGRYALFDEIAAGGMATVHLGRLLGPVGFSRTVAIKRLHAHFAKDPEFSAGFVDEARLAARIHHPNVVPIIDVLHDEGELSLVMDYVEGDSLAKLLRITVQSSEKIPLNVASSIVCGSLYGLHAAHEAVDETGEAMHIVHRDVSPQNILVGSDGVPRIVDFGVAKAAQRLQTTADGQVKGKIAYMAPEQIRQAAVSRKTDIYAMGVVLWETITGKRLFQSENHANLMSKVLEGSVTKPSQHRKDCSPELDALVLRALSMKPQERFETARQMAAELQKLVPPAPQTDVGDWVNLLARDALTDRRQVVKRVESSDLPVDGDSAKEFISRPSHPELLEDVLTVVERGRPHHREDDSTQAVTTGRAQARSDTNRIFVPLILGLALVVGVITAILVRNRPELEEPLPETQAAALPEQSPPSPAPVPSPPLETIDPVAPSDTPEPKDEAPEEEPETDEAPAKQPPAVAPVRKLPPKKAACPKFVVDGDGIRRINRKCWK